MFDALKEIFQNQILYPVLNDNPKYTVGETFLYALLFLVFVYLAIRFFEKLKVSIDFRFYLGWVGWILLMAVSRVLEDQGVLTSRLFITPYIDFFFIALAFFMLFILKYAQNKGLISFDLVWVPTPYIIAVIFALQLSISNVYGGLLVLLLAVLLIGAVVFIRRYLKDFLSWENVVALSAHLFDASTTFVAIYMFGAFEKHVVPDFLIGIFGPWIMFPLKIAVISVALYYIDKNLEDGTEKQFFKLIIFSMGMGPGLRNLIQIVGY